MLLPRSLQEAEDRCREFWIIVFLILFGIWVVIQLTKLSEV